MTAQGRVPLDVAVALLVPVCLQMKELHDRGETAYLHASSLVGTGDGLVAFDRSLSLVPTHARDKCAMPPELQASLAPGDATASVYSVGAILYELITGDHIGPGMRRPKEVDPKIPESIEILIGKAIIGDRSHRPGDLGALASALYHTAPAQSIRPPEVDLADLDRSAEAEVDIKFSMMPPNAAPMSRPEPSTSGLIPRPAPMPAMADPFGGVVERPSMERRPEDPAARLSALKTRLESDPRPRYVVHKDRMDHGPFSAVELLQQIATSSFTLEDVLRDEISRQEMPIAEWEEFSLFAEQAKLNRQFVAEEKAVFQAAKAEKKGGRVKLLVGSVVLLVLLGALSAFLLRKRGTRSEEVAIEIDRVSGAGEASGTIGGRKKSGGGFAGGPGGGAPGAPGAPGYSGGESFENALNNNNQVITMGGAQTPDLTNAQLSAPLRQVSFIGACGAPDDMKVTVRVAVKMGRAAGVTVSTNPPSPGVAACVDRHVRGLSWPVSEKADFVTVSY